jgi:hypothetical protein
MSSACEGGPGFIWELIRSTILIETHCVPLSIDSDGDTCLEICMCHKPAGTMLLCLETITGE